MRGAFFIVILIAMLIVGVLVIRDMKTETDKGVDRTETIHKAKAAARTVDKAMKRIRDAAREDSGGYDGQ